MKIGILTYHRTNNYGALLQAVALRNYLQRQGHEVFYVDYWPDYHRDQYRILNLYRFKRANIIRKLRILHGCIIDYKGKRKRIKSFSHFINTYIVPYCKPYKSDYYYDIVIYGSDQIWRKQSAIGKKFNPVYFGKNTINTNRHMSYAASMGLISLDEKDKGFLLESLQKFCPLTVREADLLEELKALGLNHAKWVIDPTLLLNGEEWTEVIPLKKRIDQPYVLLYQLGNSINRKYAEDFAKRKGLKLIILGSRYNRNYPNDLICATPEDFLSLIKYSDFVLTGSYHGLVFSLNFNRPFYCSFEKNSNRAETILKSLSIPERLVPADIPLPIEQKEINWAKVNSDLNYLRSVSMKFLSF